jgi:hypothetical protein
MKAILTAAICGAALMYFAPASADPWKDESGHGWRGGYERGDAPRSYKKRQYVIPYGHLPPPGECRTWYLDRPAGHQPPPYRCRARERGW